MRSPPSWPTARSRCPTACRPRSRWSVRARRVTATTPPMSRSSSRRRPAPTRAPSPSSSRRSCETDAIADVEVAGPGFLNITVDAGAQGQVAADIVAAGESYGASDAFAGEKINLEFVSANPTGPLHLGGVRWAAVGDALGRIFTLTGAEVTREYYFNDHGAQLDRFSTSLMAWAKGLPVPEDGYGGDYIGEIAKDVMAKQPDVLELPDEEAQEVFRAEGVELMFAEIKQSLRDFGVDFDVYFHEDNLHQSGAVKKAIDRLTELGNTYEADGALWLRTEQFGDDKDRVIVRSNGPAGLSLRRPRLLPRQAGARLRPLLHHARRRPPRLCRPDERHVRRVRRRAGQEPRDPDRPDGQPAARRGSRCGCPSGQARSSRSTTSSGDRRRRQPLRPRALTRATRRSTSTSTCGRRPATTTRSSPCSTPTRAPAVANDRQRRSLGHDVRPGPPLAREGGRAAAGARRVPARRHRRGRAARAAPGRSLPRGHWPAPTTGSTTAAGCCRAATRRRRELHRARLMLVDATRQVLANGLGLLGVSAPERM